MTLIKNAVKAAAESATTAALKDSKASNAKFNGGAGDDFLFVQGDNNLLIGCVGDDLIYSEGNNNDIFGDIYYDYTASSSSSGCDCCKCKQESEKPSEGGNDQIYSFGNCNALLGGVGEDLLYSEGDYNYIEDHEGSTTLRNFGESNSILLGDATHDIVSIGSNTDMELGDGEHQILIAGKNNEVRTGNGAFKFIYMGDLNLNGGDVVEDDETSTGYNRLIETFTRLATKIEVDETYSDEVQARYDELAEKCELSDEEAKEYAELKTIVTEYKLYSKYAEFAEMIGNYTPPEESCGCGCQWIENFKSVFAEKDVEDCGCK